MRGGFTIAKLAEALRGMPREARMLIRLPDERLVEIDHVRPTHLSDDNAALPGGYGIILVAADVPDDKKTT